MQVFTISQKASAKKAKLHLVVRLGQAALFMLLIAGAIVAIIVSPLSLTDCFAVALAIVPTGWGLISVSYLTSFIPYSGTNVLITFHMSPFWTNISVVFKR